MLQDGPLEPITLLKAANNFGTVNDNIATLKEKGLIIEMIRDNRLYLELTEAGRDVAEKGKG